MVPCYTRHMARSKLVVGRASKCSYAGSDDHRQDMSYASRPLLVLASRNRHTSHPTFAGQALAHSICRLFIRHVAEAPSRGMVAHVQTIVFLQSNVGSENPLISKGFWNRHSKHILFTYVSKSLFMK